MSEEAGTYIRQTSDEVVALGVALREGVVSTMMGRGYSYGYDMMGGGWLGGLLMLVFGALVVAGIVLLILWAVKASSSHGSSGGSVPPAGPVGHDEAVAVARRRLASGEITAEEYEQILRALGG